LLRHPVKLAYPSTRLTGSSGAAAKRASQGNGWSVVPLWKPLPEGLLHDLLQSGEEWSAHQRAQPHDITRCMDISVIDPHFQPGSGCLHLHPIAIGGPLDTAEPSEAFGDFANGHLKAPAGLFLSPTVRDCEANQGHLSIA
jgi:hypothetical protein